jgi:hypothetical protein
MPKFVIAPHRRLHEWVARDKGKGYFETEGLQYAFRNQLAATPTGRIHDLGDKIGAYQTFERGRDSDISCACHWRRWGPGERIVFEPYTREAFAESREWIAAHGIFMPAEMGSGIYDDAILSLPA